MTAAPPLETLRLSGRVVRPGDPDYETARTPWNHLATRRPAAVAYVRNTQDVIDAVDWARRHRVEIRVRSGGHSLVHWSSVDDGLIIDLTGLKAVTVTSAAHGHVPTALLGAGLTQGEVVAALGRSGVTVPLGNEGSMALVGATLGGGFGLLSRAYGLVSDQLLGVEMVVAGRSGRTRSICVDVEQHADLLWALRGGGNGTFGIVTSLLMRTQPVRDAVVVRARWSGLDDAHAVFDSWQRSAPATDHRLTSQLEIRRTGVDLLAVMVDGSVPQALGLLAPVLGHGRPEVTGVDRAWTEVFDSIQTPIEQVPANWKSTSQFADEPLPAEAIDTITSFLAVAPTDHCSYFAQAFGGAVLTGEPLRGGAYAHRHAWIYGAPGAGWGERGGPRAAEDPLTGSCLAWIADISRALTPWADGAYVNVPNPELPFWEEAYWGGNVHRLRQVKTRYDPEDVFHHQQSSTPLRLRPAR